MSLSISIDQQSAQQIATLIGGVTIRARNLKPANDKALAQVMADVDQRFISAPGVSNSGSVYGGVTWPKLTDEYLQYRSVVRKTKTGTLQPRIGGQQLRDTGTLLQSFQIGQAENITENNPTNWAFGSSLPKARGLDRKRPMLFFHAQLIEVLINIYAQYLTGEQ